MYYCQQCGLTNKWPIGMTQSVGPCEVCGKVKSCFDVPSRLLPEREATPREISDDIIGALEIAQEKLVKVTGIMMRNKETVKAKKFRRMQKIIRNIQNDIDGLSR